MGERVRWLWIRCWHYIYLRNHFYLTPPLDEECNCRATLRNNRDLGISRLWPGILIILIQAEALSAITSHLFLLELCSNRRLNHAQPVKPFRCFYRKSLRSPALPLTNYRPGMVFLTPTSGRTSFVCRWMMRPGTTRLEGWCGKRMENMTTQWYHVYIYIHDYIHNYIHYMYL